MTFGEKVKALRSGKGLPAKELGRRVGVSAKSISNYENGSQLPRAKMCEALAKELGVTVSELTDDTIVIDTQRSAFAGKEEGAEAPAAVPVRDNMTFSQKLNTLRREKGLRLKDIADAAGITLNSYKMMEYRGSRPGSAEVYQKLADALGCEASWLSEGDKRLKDKPKRKAAADSAKKDFAKKDSGKAEVIRLVSRLSVLLSGDEITEGEKDAIMLSLNGAYWKGK
ncbi:MAG TPA: hypothetical protein DCL38_03565 [Lachnospiraceae bacterium]|nr:hypothetical protein [Lachnospiraceae bacterium]